jgi:hypothetical protein
LLTIHDAPDPEAIELDPTAMAAGETSAE